MVNNETSLEADDSHKLHELFNRSPHPYHRRSFNSSERLSLAEARRSDLLQLDNRRGVLSGQSSPGRTSPSDSGTEADDEKPLLRALTAPPSRPRKGLKSSSSYDGTSSPLLTPSYLEEDRTRLLAGHAASERQKSRTRKGNATREIKRLQRKGIEAQKRLLETLLFFGVAWISLRSTPVKATLLFWKHVAVTSVVCATYVPRLLFHIVRSRPSGHAWSSVWFPASADPAPLLYPVFLPLIITLSANGIDDDPLSGYILSFCAIPRGVIPFRSFYLQWLLSLTPLVLNSSRPSSSGISPEELVLLYPLHCALLQTLYFLTTTSLLTTELQLLSIALINLLGVPKTPQSSILKALLWVGGLSVLVTCRHVLKLSVELARIPTWRLRKTRRSGKSSSTIYCAIDDSLGGFLSRNVFSSKDSDDSDEDNSYGKLKLRARKTLPQQVSRAAATRLRQTSAMDDSSFARSSPSFKTDRPAKQRRHTLPGSLTALPDIPTITRTATDAISSARTRSRLILRLTLPQAIVLKWLYAAFVYLVTILVILVPIRLYVQYFALDGNEPIGWALGYLFGDYQPFRMQVLMLRLDTWITLPPRLPHDWSLALAEYTRQEVLGAANTRLAICAYCILWIAVGLIIVFRLSNVVEVDTRRKVFHGMMVAMFLPTIFIDPTFIALAFTLILAIFLLLDLFRASQLPPLSKPLTYFLAPYVDGRDHKGPIIISHIFLLIGCAIPLWLSLASVKHTGEGPTAGWEVPTRDVSMVTGVICVGMGDAAASLIGRRYGRRRWPWSGGKSLEGSAAFALAVVVGLTLSRIWLVTGGWPGDSGEPWGQTIFKSAVAAVGASLTEAVLTGGNDNVVVPIILWLLTRGLAI